MSLNMLIGQEYIRKILIKSLISPFHNYLFVGEKGLGKRLFAYTFAKQLLCEQKTLCKECRNCRMIENGIHPDLIAIKLMENKRDISIEAVRDVINNIVKPPIFASKKVIIIEKAEEMSKSAQNALLKTLEEPPEYIVFIMTCDSLEMLLPTIISRSLVLRFNRYKKDEIQQIIEQKGMIPKDYIIKLSKGNPLTAQNIYNQEYQYYREVAFEILNKTYKAHFAEIKFFEELYDKFENTDILFEILTSVIRDIIVYKITKKVDLIFNADKIDFIVEFSKKHTLPRFFNMISDIIEIEKYKEGNVVSSNIADLLFLKLSGGK